MNESNVEDVAKALNGFKIVGFGMTHDEFDGMDWGRIILENKNGVRAFIEPSMDAEGNGPGFCFFGPEEQHE